MKIRNRKTAAPRISEVCYTGPPGVNSTNDALSFYTSDLEGKYVVVLQGISESGKAFSTSSSFEVKK